MDGSETPSRLPKLPSQLPQRDGAKRRSLLLPKGTISAVARKPVLSLTEEETPQQRPVTMYGGNAQGLADLRRQLDAVADNESTDNRSPESREHARTEAHAALTGGSRPQSSQSSTAGSGIMRSASIRTGPGARTVAGRTLEPGQSRIGGSKPTTMLGEKSARPQSVISTSLRAPNVDRTSRLKAPSLAPPASATGLRRSATTASRHTRTQSALPGGAPADSIIQPRTDLRRHPTISEGTTSRLQKPAFSTLQQHFSPKKNLAPKPASSSLINAQPPDAGPSLGMETQLLQARLLQLAILHRQAEPTYQAWESSAKRRLKHKFTDVAAECEVVRQKEKEWRRRANTGALKIWSNGQFGLLAENLRTLSHVVNEVTQLVGVGGRVQQTIEIFEAWITWVEAVYQNRQNHNHASVEFVEGLGEGWKSEIAALMRKMAGFARQLNGLGEAEEGSSISQIIVGHTTLIKGVIEELRAINAIEDEVVNSESRWIDEQLSRLDSEIRHSHAIELAA